MAGWLYAVDAQGLLVTPEFVERLRKGRAGTLRELAKLDLTALYRARHTKLSRDQMQPGLFWSVDPPALVRIPLVRGGLHPPPAMVPDYVAYREVANKREMRFIGKQWKDEAVQVKIRDKKVTVTVMKPNPKFELVVVNKYDRAALLNLLTELDTASNVETWLAERMKRAGATQADALYADYKAWCEKREEAWTGTKSFVQALVAARVVKLKRGRGGSRYELELK